MSTTPQRMAEIADGIEAYAEQQATIKQAIVDHGGELHQNDFDEEFCKRPFFRHVVSFDDHTFLLGGVQGGFRAKWLDLAQHMALAGILDIQGERPNVKYCLPQGNAPK